MKFLLMFLFRPANLKLLSLALLPLLAGAPLSTHALLVAVGWLLLLVAYCAAVLKGRACTAAGFWRLL